MEEVSGYCVDVIGFNETERLLLQSIFTLAARRDPAFIQRDPNSDRPVDLYLVDADDDAAFNEFKAVHSRYRAPAVLVGLTLSSGIGTCTTEFLLNPREAFLK